ncbi:MAG: hypothetical protein U1F77_00560 [Kiritimatiellia bacterium]
MSSPTSRQLVLFLLFNPASLAAAVAGAAVQGSRESGGNFAGSVIAAPAVRFRAA